MNQVVHAMNKVRMNKVVHTMNKVSSKSYIADIINKICYVW